MANPRVYTRYCPELEKEISCVVIGEMRDGRKVYVSMEDTYHQFMLIGGRFRVLTDGAYEDL